MLIQPHMIMKIHKTSLSTGEDFISVMEEKTKSNTSHLQVSSHHDKTVMKKEFGVQCISG